MSPKKSETFIKITNDQVWEICNELKKSADSTNSLIANIRDEIADIKSIIEKHDMLLQKYESLRNTIVGGWIVLVLVGGVAIFSIQSYIQGVVREIVDEYDITVIN
jgi:hypothetical protein